MSTTTTANGQDPKALPVTQLLPPSRTMLGPILRPASSRHQEDFVRAARSHGLPWTVGILRKLEDGTRQSTSLGEWSLLPVVANTAAESHGDVQPVDLAMLLPDEQPVALTDSSTATGGALRHALSGVVSADDFILGGINLETTPIPVDLGTRFGLSQRRERALRDVFARGINDETTLRMAKSRGLDLEVVALAAAVLFNATVSEERERLRIARNRDFSNADERRTMLGRITREIRESIEQAINEGTTP